ncbi:MAG: lipid-A-disaccharide synthase [Elusimicrobia bacterium]|nr:lipid-A-disaccharide synthase [Elusimicrobiota bacterium]
MARIVPTTKNILVIAGDPSGDLHASNLITALKKKDPGFSISSLGGVRMQEVSSHFIYNLANVGAMGFAAPIRHFVLWVKLIGLVRRYLEERRPACVIAVDFYGFNHQILGLAHHRKIPAFYYISPQVWASRPGRAKRIAKLVKEIFLIFPFEKEIYEKAGAKCEFVGHPLIDLVPPPTAGPAENKKGAWRIGILPGSRLQEITKHLTVFVEAFYKIKSVYPDSRAYLFAVPEFSDETLKSMLAGINPQSAGEIEIVRELDYKIRSTMDFSFASSGTATLENALMGVPMVVAYKMPALTYQVAKRLIKIPYISLVNILLKNAVVKELVQKKAVPDRLAQEAFAVLNNPARVEKEKQTLTSVRGMLGSPGVAARVAERILNYLKQ